MNAGAHHPHDNQEKTEVFGLLLRLPEQLFFLWPCILFFCSKEKKVRLMMSVAALLPVTSKGG